MTSLQAWVDGALVPLRDATVSVLDQGFRTGEGVFETMRAYDGHVFRLSAHLRRAADGAQRLGFTLPGIEDLARAVQATVAANAAHVSNLAVRLTVTPGPMEPDSPWPLRPTGRPTIVITAHVLGPDTHATAEGVRAVTVPWMRELGDVKAVSYLASSLARQVARDAGADEALLTDGDGGHVVEGAASNVFAVGDGIVVTPPLDGGILPGVTRATVMEVAPAIGVRVVEAPLPVTDLLSADEVFVTATTREVVPVVRVDDTVIGTGRPGPVTLALLDAYRREVAREVGGDTTG